MTGGWGDANFDSTPRRNKSEGSGAGYVEASDEGRDSGQIQTEEYQRIHGVWCDESGLPIEVEALMRVAGVDCSAFCNEVWAPTVAARRLAS